MIEMEEFTKSIKAHLYERATSPLLGSFVMSWLLWNFKIVLVVISSMSPTDKIMYIDLLSAIDADHWFTRSLIFPLVTSIAYIFLFPFPARFVFVYSRRQQLKTKLMQQQIDNETPITREEARDIRAESHRIALEFEDETKRLREKVQLLMGESAEKDEIISSLRYEMAQRHFTKSSDELSSSQLEVLETICNNPKPIAKELFLKTPNRRRVDVEVDLDTLLERGLINDTNFGGEPHVLATAAGRKFLVSHERSRESLEA